MTEPDEERLVASIAGNLSRVSREDVIARSIEHFRKPDPAYGARVGQGVRARRSKRGAGVGRHGASCPGAYRSRDGPGLTHPG